MTNPFRLAEDVLVYVGDVREQLKLLPDNSVQCVVTSPPYWGLRDYGVPGQLGLEPTPEEYVENMVQVFREVRRVLRPDGTLWLNLGDTYHNVRTWMQGGQIGQAVHGRQRHGQPLSGAPNRARRLHGLKDKDLIGIPWMVAFALRDDGWYLRSDIIWAKPNPMPESVTDRPTKAHEYIFLLAKSQRYYYDADAIREPHTVDWIGRTIKSAKGNKDRNDGGKACETGNPAGRNKRSVWWIATEPTPFAHFATFPQALVEPCILAGTSPQACPRCGAPWERVVRRVELAERDDTGRSHSLPEHRMGKAPPPERGWQAQRLTEGWRPTCSCSDNDGSGRCVVLDPFAGSGTTLLVAARLGREAWGIELNPAYVDIMKRRLAGAKAQRQFAF